MTKEELKWIYGAITLTGAAFIFILYLISNYSPLAQSDQGIDLNNLENNSEATSSFKLDFDQTE